MQTLFISDLSPNDFAECAFQYKFSVKTLKLDFLPATRYQLQG